MSVKVMRIATGEEEEEIDSAKSAAAELGSRGGKARAAKLLPRRKREESRRQKVGEASKTEDKSEFACWLSKQLISSGQQVAGTGDDDKGSW